MGISRVSTQMKTEEEVMKTEEDGQVPSTSKEENPKEITKYKLNRSLSLRSIEDPTKEETNSKKRKNLPSPKGSISVKETTSKFDQLASKYKNQRNLKDTTKEKSKFKRNVKKNPIETIEDPVTKMLKKIMSDISEIKSDVKGNNSKIDDLTSKVENLETKGKENEETMNEKLKKINDDIGKVEVRVTEKLMAEIEPSLGVMKSEIQNSIGTDLRRLVQEEVTLQRMRESKETGDAANKEDGPEKEKKYKNTKKK